MLDERIEKFRSKTQPPWDDLREHRILRGARRRLDERRARRGARRRAAAIALPAVIAVAAMLVAYVAGVASGRRTVLRPPSASSVAAIEAPQGTSAGEGPGSPEVRLLADGLRLELSPMARVEVSLETGARVELAQSGGRVRYEVARVPARAFVVRANGVRVEVTGTVFVVSCEGEKVSIQVDEGRVRVWGPGGEAELGVGDELTVVAPQKTAASRPPPPSPPAAPAARAEPAQSASSLLERADMDRTAGDLVSAAARLREFITRYPNDARAALAWFTLGKVERARSRPAAAARAFRAVASLSPGGTLAEDALAEEAAAWAAAGESATARGAIERYLRKYPSGTHADRLRNLL